MQNAQIIGIFSDESQLLKAIHKLRRQGANILDVYGPATNHDLIKALTPESKLPYISVLTGIFTVLATFAFVYYVSVIDYPLRYGGKPVFSFPPMVVILFLACILVTGGVSTFAFLGREQMYPGKPTLVPGPGSLDDKFYLVMDQNFNPEEISQWLRESGAEEVIAKEFAEDEPA